MSKKIIIIAIFAAALIGGGAALAAHHSGTYSNDNSAMPVAQGTAAVVIQSYAFGPDTLKIKVGTTVTWTNQDSVHHTVTGDDNMKGPNSDQLGQGQSYSFQFKTAGTFNYDCKIHPQMRGTVIVED